MAVEETYVDVQFHGGVDQHTSGGNVTPPNTLVAENVHHRSPGGAGIRDSYSKLTGSPIDGALAIFSTSDEAVGVVTSSGEVWSVDNSGQTLVDPMGVPVANVEFSPLFQSDRVSRLHDVAIIDDLALLVWHYEAISSDAAFVYPSNPEFGAGVYYGVVDIATGRTVKSATFVGPGDYCSVNTVQTVDAGGAPNGGYVFLLTYSAPSAAAAVLDPFLGSWHRETFAAAVDTDGTILHTATVNSDTLLWDVHCSGNDDPNVFLFIAESDNAANYYNSGSGQGVVCRIEYDSVGAQVNVYTLSLPTSPATWDVRDLSTIYHDADTNKIFLAFASEADSAPAPAATGIYTATLNDDLTGLSAAPTLVTLTNMGTNIGPYTTPGGSSSENLRRFLTSTLRGAFVKFQESGTDRMLLLHGCRDPEIYTGTGLVPANSAGGIRKIIVDATGALVGSSGVLEPSVMMMSKPWYDGESAKVLVGVSPPVPVSANADGGNMYPAFVEASVGTITDVEHTGRRANQSAYYIADVGTSEDTFLRPIAIALVDEALSGKQLPTFANTSSPCILDSEVIIPVSSLTRVVDLNTDDTDGWNILWLQNSIRGSYTGGILRVVVGAIGTPARLPIELIDDTVIAGYGSMSYFDGENSRPSCIIPLKPYMFSPGAGGGSLLSRDDSVVAVTYSTTDAKGNVHRTAEAVLTDGFLTPQINEYPPTLLETRIPIPPLTLYKGSQRNEERTFAFILTNTIEDGPTQIGELTFFERVAVSQEVDNFHMYSGPLPSGARYKPFGMFNTGELMPEVVNGARFIVSRRDRVFFVDEIHPNIIRYSKIIGATTTVEFNNNLQVRIPESTGGVVALGVMDDKIIAFTEDKTFYFAGEGPNNLGEGSFTAPRPIASSHGCVNPRSVISTHKGVFFQSRRGLMLLDRNLVTHYIGDRVERYMQVATITSVIEDSVTNEVRWVCSNSDVPNGSETTQALVYNQDNDAWSRWFGMHTDAGLTSSTTPIDSTFHEGMEYVLMSDGNVIKQERDVKDLSSGNLVVGTPWLSAGGRLDMMRVREMHALFEMPTEFGANESFQLAVVLYFNFLDGSGPAQVVKQYDIGPADITFGAVPTFSSGEVIQTASIRLPLDIQKCSSFRAKIQISPAGGEYSTPATDILLTNLGFVVAQKPAGNKVPNNASS